MISKKNNKILMKFQARISAISNNITNDVTYNLDNILTKIDGLYVN